MSIDGSFADAVRRLCDEGQLFPLPCATPHRRPRRIVVLAAELRRQLWRSPSPTISENQAARLLADLQFFAEEMGVPVPTFLKPMSQGRDGVWEFRQPRPSPSIRVFALFRRRDVVVLSHLVLRNQLGSRNEPGWGREIRRSRHEWRRLFPYFDPLTGGKVSD